MSQPLDLVDIAERLRGAAKAELYGVDLMERMAAQHGAGYATALSEVRRQAEALGESHRIVLALLAHPEVAAVLGLEVAP